jgi:TonB family protein
MRLSGVALLAVTVNESGFVSDVKSISGHPILRNAAIEAAKQYQYSPILLKGQAVPVRTKINVAFVNKDGRTEVGSGANAPQMPALPWSASFMSSGPDYIIDVRGTIVDESGLSVPNAKDNQPAKLEMPPATTMEWLVTAKAGWPNAQGAPLVYSFLINEKGELKNFTRVQGPEIADLEKKISQVHVISPGFRGPELARSRYTIEFRFGLSSEEISNLIKAKGNH